MRNVFNFKGPGRSGAERGATLMVGAGAVVALMAVAALVVDLGLVRNDRARQGSNADAIAAAAVLGIPSGGGVAGCASALGYVTETVGAVAGLSCAGFPSSCTSATTVATTTGTGSGVTVKFTYPVDDADPLMTPTSGGAQVISVSDGSRCNRFGVSIRQQRAALFAQVLGENSVGTTIHSVALVGDPIRPPEIINLLLVEPNRCPALEVNGGGSNGGVYVKAVVDPLTGEVHPGRIAIDSDGTNSCSGATIETSGGHGNVHAQGAAGCATELTPGTGWGCGDIQTFAAGAPGCNPPACSGSGSTVWPPPTKADKQRTRSPFDWRFNCKPVYPASMGIPGCPHSASTNAYIQGLEDGNLYSGGLTPFSTSPHNPAGCNIKSSDVVVMPVDNYLIDCSPLSVKGILTFVGGNLVVDDDIDLSSGGTLNVNTINTDTTYSWTQGAATDVTEHSTGAAFVYFRAGEFKRTSGSNMNLHHTMVYLSSSSDLDLSGGGGTMSWTAPIEGPFADLALWSESSATHSIGGSASLTLEGVVFTPNAKIKLHGNGGIATAHAQFVARSLETNGGGAIEIAPIFGRSVTHPAPTDSELIR